MTVRTGGLLAIAALAFGAVGAALVTQHAFGMEPCPWCVLQRLIFVVIGLVALLGLAWRTALGQRAVLFVLLLLCSGGIAAALWQHFQAAASASCNLTLADKIVSGLGLTGLWPDVFEPRASCAEAAVNLLGVPYDFWSLALFALIALVLFGVMRQPDRGRQRGR